MINNTPSFKGFHISPKALDKINSMPLDFVEEQLLPTAEIARNNSVNHLSIDDNGKIYIETPKFGKITVDNPACQEASGRYFSCNVRSENGETKRIYVPFKNEEKAKTFATKNFGGGAYIPTMNLDLYKAIVAADLYKQNLVDKLYKLSE